MIDLAAKVPSSFNLQPWNLMVLRDVSTLCLKKGFNI